MSHPDPCYDPDNSYEDDNVDYNFDDVSAFYGDYRDDLTHEELDSMWDEEEDDVWCDEYDDSMDGDFDSAMRDAGFGTDEDYGYYGEDY